MNLDNLTGTELLYRKGNSNKIFVQIPNSPFHIVLSRTKSTDTWKATLVELMGTKRKCFAGNLTRAQASKLMAQIMENGKSFNFKHADRIVEIKSFANELSLLIKKPKQKHDVQ